MVVRERSSHGWAGRGCAETKTMAINTLPGLGLVRAVGRRGWEQEGVRGAEVGTWMGRARAGGSSERGGG